MSDTPTIQAVISMALSLLSGVSAQSFIHSFTLTSSAFNVFLATPGVSHI